MRKLVSMMAAVAVGGVLALGAAAPAHAQSGSGYADCSSTYSYTRVNSNAQIRHWHEYPNNWAYDDKPAGISSWKKFWKPGLVWMELNTIGGFSGAVYGCSA